MSPQPKTRSNAWIRRAKVVALVAPEHHCWRRDYRRYFPGDDAGRRLGKTSAGVALVRMCDVAGCHGLPSFVVGRRLLRGQRSLEAAARRVEAESPELGSSLINLVQLADHRQTPTRPFARPRSTKRPPSLAGCLSSGPRPRKSRRPAGPLHADAPRPGRVAGRLGPAGCCRDALRPGEFPPGVRRRSGRSPLGRSCLRSDRLTPQRHARRCRVLLGEDVEIAAEIKNPQGKPHRACCSSPPRVGRNRRRP